jgi:putative inorganic carbon (HCO3(-)) transporter
VVSSSTTDATVSEQPFPLQRRRIRQKPLLAAYAALVVFMIFYWARPEDVILFFARVPVARISLILAALALLVSLKDIRRRFPQEVFLLFLLIAQLFVAAVLSPVWRGGAVKETVEFAKILIVVAVIVAAVNTVLRLRMLMSIQVLSITAIVAVGILKGYSMGGRQTGSLEGNYSDPNELAFAIAMAIPLGLVLILLNKNGVTKIFWGSSVLLMIYGLLRTGSRAGFLTLLIAVAVFLWEFAIRGSRRYLLVLVVLAGFILWQSSNGMLAGRLRGTFNHKDDVAAAYDSARAREQLFWRSVDITKQHPLFGVGPGNFDTVSGQWHTTHNSLTLMSSEGGIPALILYVWILWCGFKNLRAAKRLARGRTQSALLARTLLASLWGYAVGSLFLSVAYEFYPYILVAYTTALLWMVRKSAADQGKYERSREKIAEGESEGEIAESGITLHPL